MAHTHTHARMQLSIPINNFFSTQICNAYMHTKTINVRQNMYRVNKCMLEEKGCLLRCNVHTHPDDPMHMHVKAVHQNNSRLKQVPHIETICRMRGVKLCVLHYDNRPKGKNANAIGAITTSYAANLVVGSSRWMDGYRDLYIYHVKM